jgi:hypothetical protein
MGGPNRHEQQKTLLHLASANRYSILYIYIADKADYHYKLKTLFHTWTSVMDVDTNTEY